MSGATELLPCPFCGVTPTRINHYGYETYPTQRELWAVDHRCCPGHGYSKQDAAQNWNRRAPTATKENEE